MIREMKTPSMSADFLKREMPIAVAYLASGCQVQEKYQGNAELICLTLGKKKIVLSSMDYELAQKIYRNCKAALAIGAKSVVGTEDILECVRVTNKLISETKNAKVLMVKDQKNIGSAYWRMSLPSEFLGVSVDLCDTIDPMMAMEYETIMVQLSHNWDSYYALLRLKQMGKRIVYDIDDDLFSIDPDNRAYSLFGNDEKAAALECMAIADYVTVSTEYLGWKLDRLGVKNIVVIPNSHKVDDYFSRNSFGSPDGLKRIFWSGSSSHDRDWLECLEAVVGILSDRPETRLLICGGIPTTMFPFMDKISSQVQFQAYTNPETYFSMLKGIRADVALAPLKDTEFNRSKSGIRFLEASMAGIPLIASDVEPYKMVVEDGENGIIVKDSKGWREQIERVLDGKINGKMLVENARRTLESSCSIKNTAETWKEVLGVL